MKRKSNNTIGVEAEPKSMPYGLSFEDAISALSLLSTSSTSTIVTNGSNNSCIIANGVQELSEEDIIIKRVMELLARAPVVEHKCHNCGGTLEIEENKHIFICPYCGSCYAIGTNLVNDKGK